MPSFWQRRVKIFEVWLYELCSALNRYDANTDTGLACTIRGLAESSLKLGALRITDFRSNDTINLSVGGSFVKNGIQQIYMYACPRLAKRPSYVMACITGIVDQSMFCANLWCSSATLLIFLPPILDYSPLIPLYRDSRDHRLLPP